MYAVSNQEFIFFELGIVSLDCLCSSFVAKQQQNITVCSLDRKLDIIAPIARRYKWITKEITPITDFNVSLYKHHCMNFI